MALGIDDLRVGTWTHDTVPTGCTVLLPPAGALVAMAVRGQSPGTRESAALGPFGKLEVCHGVVLSGGSAYGLATADGVVQYLEEQGIGYPVGSAIVPIVGAAIVLDLGVASPGARPGAAAGRAAAEAAVTAEPPEGSVGAGAGCTVAKVGGLEHAWRGGQGVAVRRVDDLVVGALVVNNAVGEVLGEDGSRMVASRAPDDVPRWPRETDVRLGATAGQAEDGGPTGNTVIGLVATNATLTKSEAHRVADLAFTGIARAVDPAHTSLDGDAMFCCATGRVSASVDRVATLAADAVAEAARRGPALAVDLELPAGTGAPFGERLPGRASSGPSTRTRG